MLYYNDEPVLWNRLDQNFSQVEKLVSDEIKQIKAKYFGDNTMKRVVLLYPKGKPKEKDKGFTILKKYPIPLNSSDGAWRWTASKKKKDGTFNDKHRFITHATVFHEKDVEFLWFLLNRSSVLNRFIYLEDLEGEAKEEVEQMSTDADIRYMIMGKSSPISKDEKLIREVAEIFGVEDVKKKGIYQVKKDLYDVVVEGQEVGDRFVNFEKFEELTEGSVKRKAAFKTREAILDGLVGYKDRAWWIMSGRKHAEKLMSVKAGDAAYRDELLIEEVVNNPNVRSRLFSALGEEEYTTADDLRELDRPTLMRKAKDEGLETKNNDKVEDLVKKLCDHYNVEYTPKEG